MPTTEVGREGHEMELLKLLRKEPELTFRLCKKLGLGDKASDPEAAAAAIAHEVDWSAERESALVGLLKREIEAVVPDGRYPRFLFSTLREEEFGEDRLPVEWVAAVVYEALLKAFLTFCKDPEARRRLEVARFAATCYVRAVHDVYDEASV